MLELKTLFSILIIRSVLVTGSHKLLMHETNVHFIESSQDWNEIFNLFQNFPIRHFEIARETGVEMVGGRTFNLVA